MQIFDWSYKDDTAKINEVWHQNEGKFTLFEVFDHAYDAKTHNIDFLRIKRCQAEGCNISDFYPQFFDYCPSCGAGLVPVVTPSVQSWASPYGNPDGSRNLSALKWNLATDELNKEKAFSLPKEGGNFTFLVSEGTKTLIAIDRAPRPEMRIFSYSIAMESWVLHNEPIPNFICPPWAWSAASGPDGFALPTKEGPCWISLSKSEGRFLHDLSIEKYKNCRSVGGATVCRDIALIPIKCEEGLTLAWRACITNTSWRIASIVNEVVEIKNGFLGAAIQDGVNNVFWSGERGYLSVHIDKEIPQAKWHRWKEGYEGCPQFMPYRDRHSVLWQLCFNKEEGVYCFKLISHAGISDRRIVDGPHFTIGNKSFCDDKIYEEPWSDEPHDYYPEKEYFVQPLVELANGLLYIGVRNVNKILEYIDPQKTSKYSAELSIRKNEGGDVKVKDGFSITSPWDAEAFLFNEGLYLYLGNQNKSWVWPNIYEDVIQ